MKISVKNAVLIGFDMVCFCVIATAYYILSSFASNSVSVNNVGLYVADSAILLVLIFAFRLLLGVYSTVWRYSSTQSYFRLILADMFGGIVAIVGCRLGNIYLGLWFFVTVAALNALLALSARYCYRLLYKRKQSTSQKRDLRVKVAIVGAGQLGVYLANELRAHSHYQPVCFIDTDKEKVRNSIVGLRVFKPEDTERLIGNFGIQEIIVAIAQLNGDDIARFYHFYGQFGCKVKIYDSQFHGMDDGETAGRRIVREFQIEDLLFRKPMSINDKNALRYYTDKTVLVTGGGGSIGSELCRQIARCHPKRLVIFDIYENNAYEIQQELIREYGDKLALDVEIGSVRDRRRLECVFQTYRPDVVFHAAAHKHVPLMEHSSAEAIKNNVLGTYHTADMAEKYGVKKFILISTDKAVNPTNVMGASKRLCEMVVQCRTDSKTSFAAVRFGNVLGSNGSVIPLFKKQIATGGPVTITDKRIIRYFMTIPEASQLVMQAGAMAEKGELFVLDMGKPVRIYDLAENMIKLSGFIPNVDIQIEEIGLRPGEKLYEELLIKSETLHKTENNMIFVEQDTPLTRAQMEQNLAVLTKAVDECEEQGRSCAVKNAMKRVVPTFREPDELNCKAEKSEEMKMATV